MHKLDGSALQDMITKMKIVKQESMKRKLEEVAVIFYVQLKINCIFNLNKMT